MPNSVTCLVCDKTNTSVWPASAHPTQSLTQQQLHASSGAVYAVPSPQSVSTVGSLLDPQLPPSALRYSALRSDEALRLGASSDPRYPNAQRSSHSHQVRRKSHSQLIENDSSPPLVPLSYKLCPCAPIAPSTTTVVALQAQQQQQFFERQQQQQQQQQMSVSGGRGNERQLQAQQAHAGSPSLTFVSGPSSARQSSRQQQQRELSASRGSDVSAPHPQAQLHASHNQSRLAYQT